MAVERVREYMSVLQRELRFDPALARRVCAEVEDHLLEAAHERGEGEAIARFGTPEAFAEQLAAVSFHKQTRAAAASAVIVVLLMFFVMQGRLAWYAVLHRTVVWGLATTIDHVAFWLGVTAALTALICTAAWKTFASRKTFDRGRLQRAFLLSTTTAACVLILLVSDAFITAARVAGAGWSLTSTVPVASFLIECVLAGLLVNHVRRMIESRRRAGA